MKKIEYIVYNYFSDTLKDIKRQERKKTKLENSGYKLIHQGSNCLTYKEVKQ